MTDLGSAPLPAVDAEDHLRGPEDAPLLIEYADSRGLEICLETAVLHASVLAADDPTRVRLEELVKDLEGKRLEDLVSERTPEPPASGSRRTVRRSAPGP